MSSDIRSYVVSYIEEHSIKNGNDLSLKKHKDFVAALQENTKFIPYVVKNVFRLRCIIDGIVEVPKCANDECKNLVKVRPSDCPARSFDTYEFREYCSVKCMTNSQKVKDKAASTNIERYGTDNPMSLPEIKKKLASTMKDRYGVVNPMMSSEIRQKASDTMLEKYGVDSPLKSDVLLNKAKQTLIANYGTDSYAKTEEFKEMMKKENMEKYGVEWHMQSEDFWEKSKKTCLEKYGVENHTQSMGFKDSIKEISLHRYGTPHPHQRHMGAESLNLSKNQEWMLDSYQKRGGQQTAEILGCSYSHVMRLLSSYGVEINNDGVSSMEKSLFEFVSSICGDAIQSDRDTLGGRMELDILIPSKKIAIEFDGVYWHSSKFRDRRYHLNKTIAAKEKGYRLIHVFEDEWVYRQDQVKAKILSLLGSDSRNVVYARKCVVGSPQKDEVYSFLEHNHLQGSTTYSIAFSLHLEGSMVACMTFKKRSDSEYELNRYATSKRVVGGFSKIMKTAKKVLIGMDVEKIVSFADIRYSDGNLYETNGWVHEYNTPPDYQYVFGDKRVRKQNFRRKDLEKKLENYDPSLSETENMTAHGYHRIYDCGLMKFSMSLLVDGRPAK